MSIVEFQIAAAAVKKEFGRCWSCCNESSNARGDSKGRLAQADEMLDAALSHAELVLRECNEPNSVPKVAEVGPMSQRSQWEEDLQTAEDVLKEAAAERSIAAGTSMHGLEQSPHEFMPQQPLRPRVALRMPVLPTSQVAYASQPTTFQRQNMHMPADEAPRTFPGRRINPDDSALPLQKRFKLNPSIEQTPRPQRHLEASSLNAKQSTWCGALPPDKFTDAEDGLRTALLEFIDSWQGKGPPSMSAVCNGSPGVAAKGLLPKHVPLYKWVEQRLGNEIDCIRDPSNPSCPSVRRRYPARRGF